MTDTKKKLKGVKLTTPVFIAAFPKLFKPEPYKDGGKASYQMTMLIPKERKEDMKVFQAAATKAAIEAFGTNKAKWPTVKLPWKDGDEKTDLAGYAGHYFINAKSYNRVVVVGIDRQPVIEESEIYGGMYARAVINVKAVSNGSEWFITCYLQGVQKMKDGEPFGGGCDVESDFGDTPEGFEAADEFGSLESNDSGFSGGAMGFGDEATEESPLGF